MKKLILAVIVVAAGVAGAVWYSGVFSRTMDDFTKISALCSTIPAPEESDAAMAGIGWAPLDTTRISEAAEAIALFHVATRRSGAQAFDPVAEQDTFDARLAEAEALLADPATKAYGRDTDNGIVVLSADTRVPLSKDCDIFLPETAGADGFAMLVAGLDPQTETAGFATWTQGYNPDAPRPGPTVMNLTTVDANAAELVDFLGRPARFTFYSRNSYRGAE